MAQVLTAESFPPLGAGSNWGSPIERERRRRIHLSVWTYAYEVLDAPIVSDHEWDFVAQRINVRMGTGHLDLDHFFASEFSPMTGMWIHNHPELDGIRKIYERFHQTVLQSR